MIRRKRLKMHITQNELAEMIGVTQAYISKIENDRFVNVTLIEIIKISKALQLKELEVCKYFLEKHNDIFVEFEGELS
ncbi:helix-turn-helix transcriptional regulator [Terrisporobacter petrolearius]|uniref:helix-turn-helix domain-containing protein n=1 Tax=Terrisporobacter petrolearius TaxID=1460447 RepID=UPI0031CC9293